MLPNWLFEAPQLPMPENGFTQATKQTLARHAKVRTKFVNINLLKWLHLPDNLDITNHCQKRSNLLTILPTMLQHYVEHDTRICFIIIKVHPHL